MKPGILHNNCWLAAIAVLAILMSGCRGDNPCATPRAGENYTLSDNAKALVQHYADANRIIYKTPAGTEIAFEVTSRDTVSSYQFYAPCENDTSDNQTVEGTSQIMEVALSNPSEWEEPIFIIVYGTPATAYQNAGESLVVSPGKVFSNDFDPGDELFYYVFLQNNPQLIFYDSLEISGKTFYSVYEMNSPGTAPNLDVKYAVNEGLIYIKDPATGKEYVYERKE